MKPTVFIQTNERQLLGAQVSAFALRRNSRDPDAFDVRILELKDFPHLTRRDGQPYRRGGQTWTWTADDLQSFTLLRFLPPQLMGYRGRAAVIDPDVFAAGDVVELLIRDMHGKAILCRRKGAAYAAHSSSVMLLDCARLTHWRWDEDVDDLFAQRRDYSDWISLGLEPAESIGELEARWNSLDELTPQTKLLHNTEIKTQPWKTGLRLEFHLPKWSKKKWGVIPRPWYDELRARLAGRPNDRRVYIPHPDPAQERFFFSLLKEALDRGDIEESLVLRHIDLGYVRPDALSLVQGLKAA